MHVLLTSVVVDGPLAMRTRRLAAARDRSIGLQVLTLPLLAARLAGGFVRPVRRDALYTAIAAALGDGDFAELAPLADLPGMVQAVARSLGRLWRCGVDPAGGDRHPGLSDLSLLDQRVRATLPMGMLVWPDLAAAAEARIVLAPRVLGPVAFEHVRQLPPVWRRLITALEREVPVRWDQGRGGGRPEPAAPEPQVVACADPRAEVVEALRWARELIATGGVHPSQIAIVAASPTEWDDHMLALSAAANLPIHFSHGVPALAGRDGQACAALADLLAQGLSQGRVRRLLAHTKGAPALVDFPDDPLRGVRPEAHLGTLSQWGLALERARAKRDDGWDPQAAFEPLWRLLDECRSAPEQSGRQLLPRGAAALWTAALRAAPAEALGFSLQALRTPDARDPGRNVVWAPASHLVGAPRPWVRMLGLTTRSWPRPAMADPLVPEHILAFDPADAPSRSDEDRRAFAIIQQSAERQLVLSYARRGRGGGRQTPSPLIPRASPLTVRSRLSAPRHAFSESDRLWARPDEAARLPSIASAQACWRDRRLRAVTPHDGLIRANHPGVLRALKEPQSATSLRRLLRDPLGYVWRYALGWDSAVIDPSPLTLADRAFGELVHLLLQETVNALEPEPGFGRATQEEVQAALSTALDAVERTWPLERPTPPPLLWRHTLDLARRLAWRALTLDENFVTGTRSWTELEFGDPRAEESDGSLPWDPRAPVPIPGTGLTIRGAIDRLELSADDRARLTDYKTGAPPKSPARVVFAGGAELQRVLYVLAVRHHRPDVRAQARLVYLNEEPPTPYKLSGETLDAAIEEAVGHLNSGVELARRGVTLPGPDAYERWNAARLALPATTEPYRQIKQSAFAQAFGSFEAVWRAK